VPDFTIDSGLVKVATTLRAAPTSTVQVVPDVLAQSPVQPTKVAPASGNAVSVSGMPASNTLLHETPQ
jgi:hypothetical protein